MENNMSNIPQKPAEQKGVGPVIGSIIVIIVVIAGGFYFWGSKIAKDKQVAETENQAMSAFPEIDSMENEIDANQLDIPEQDLNEIEKDILNL